MPSLIYLNALLYNALKSLLAMCCFVSQLEWKSNEVWHPLFHHMSIRNYIWDTLNSISSVSLLLWKQWGVVLANVARWNRLVLACLRALVRNKCAKTYAICVNFPKMGKCAIFFDQGEICAKIWETVQQWFVWIKC